MHFSYSCQRVSLSRPAREKSRDLGDRESCCRPLPSPWHETRSFPETIFRSMQGHHRIRLTAARGRVDGQDGLAGLLLTPGPSRRSREHGFVGPSHPLAHTLWMNPFPAPSLSPVGPPGHHLSTHHCRNRDLGEISYLRLALAWQGLLSRVASISTSCGWYPTARPLQQKRYGWSWITGPESRPRGFSGRGSPLFFSGGTS